MITRRNAHLAEPPIPAAYWGDTTTSRIIQTLVRPVLALLPNAECWEIMQQILERLEFNPAAIEPTSLIYKCSTEPLGLVILCKNGPYSICEQRSTRPASAALQSDQSLLSILSTISNNSTTKPQRPWSDCMNMHADLGLCLHILSIATEQLYVWKYDLFKRQHYTPTRLVWKNIDSYSHWF